MSDNTSDNSKNQSYRALDYGEVSTEGDQTFEFHRSLAVIIGINDYGNGIPVLETAANDAARLAEILLTQHGYEVYLFLDDPQLAANLPAQPDVVKAQTYDLSSKPACSQLHLSGPATKTALETFLNQTLPPLIGPDDRLLVYFAGHGVALESEETEAGPVGYLIPQDATREERTSFIEMAAFHKTLAVLSCRHLLLILDCCFAGAIRWSFTRSLDIPPEKIYWERYQMFIKSPAWQALTSAAYDQKALDRLAGNEVGERGLGLDECHSPFALALCQALSSPAADTYPPVRNGQPAGDGLLTANELFQYIQDEVQLQTRLKAQHSQSPGLWPLPNHHSGQYVFRTPGRKLDLEHAPPLTYDNNPYRGLQSFDEEHCRLFYGREAAVIELAERVAAQPLTVVLGASGTGKSSLVKAGLLPYLRAQSTANITGQETTALHPKSDWYILLPPIIDEKLSNPIRPTEAPLRELHKLLITLTAPAEPSRLDKQSDPTVLAQAITTWRQTHPGQPLLLVIDQLEELITLCWDERERDQFLEQLGRAVEAHADHLHLVLTLRSDFEPRLAGHPALHRFWKETGKHIPPPPTPCSPRYIVKPMSRDELRCAILEPAAERVLFFDPYTLVDSLIDEVIQMPGALPLLSFTLSTLYIKYINSGRKDRALTGQDYQDMDGVVGALKTQADDLYRKLPDEAHRATLQRVILRMISTEGGELTRRRVPHTELVYPEATENERVAIVLRRLTEARLLVADVLHGVSHLELAHDALVKAWDKLLGLQHTADMISLQRRLIQAALKWGQAENKKTKTGYLWPDNPDLTQLSKLIKDKRSWLNEIETCFVEASIEEIAHQARIARSNELANKANQDDLHFDLKLMLACEAVLPTLGKDGDVQVEADMALQRAVAEANQTPWPRIMPRRVRHTSPVLSVTFSPDGQTIASASADQTVRLWDVTTGKEIKQFRGHTGFVWSVAFSPDGKQIVSGSSDQTVRLWDVKTGKELYRFAESTEGINSVAFSPMGEYIVCGGVDRAIWVLKASDLTKVYKWTDQRDVPPITLRSTVPLIGDPRVGHTGPILSVTFSQDGQTIASGGVDKTVLLWDIKKGQAVRQFTRHTESVLSVAFSPNGQQIVSSSRDKTVRLWDTTPKQKDQMDAPHYRDWAASVEEGQEIRQFTGHTEEIRSVAFSPNGKQIIGAGTDGTIWVWNVTTGKVEHQFAGHTEAVRSVAFNSKGRQQIVSGSEDNTVRVWDGETGREVSWLSGHTGAVVSVALSPDEQQIVSGSTDRTICVWNLDTGTVLHRFGGHTETIRAVAFSSDGRQIVSGSDDRTVCVWNVGTGKEGYKFTGHTEAVMSVAFSPNGKQIVSGSVDKTWRVWDVGTGKEVSGLTGHHENIITTVAFSPDGQKIASGSVDKMVRVWSIHGQQDLRLLHNLSGHTNPITSVVFNKDGNQVASGSQDGLIQIWEVQSGEQMSWLNTTKATLMALIQAGKKFICGCYHDQEQEVNVYDVASGEIKKQWTGKVTQKVTSIALGPAGQHIVAGNENGTISVWKIRPRKKLGQHEWHFSDESGPHIVHSDRITTLAVSPDGTKIISGSQDGTVHLWTVKAGEPIGKYLCTHRRSVTSVAISPDGKYILSTSEDRAIRKWDLNTEQELNSCWSESQYGQPWFTAIAFNPDGKSFVIGQNNGEMHLWETKAMCRSDQLRGSHQGSVTSVDFSQDGKLIVSGGEDKMVRIWDAVTKNQCYQLEHKHSVTSVAFNPNGQQIASGSGEIVRVWDARTGKEIRTLTGHTTTIISVAFSPHGNWIVSSSQDGEIRIWEVNTGKQLRQLIDDTGGVILSTPDEKQDQNKGFPAVFSPDGRYIISGTTDHSIRLWLADIKDLLNLANSLIQRDPPIFINDERHKFGFEGDNRARIH